MIYTMYIFILSTHKTRDRRFARKSRCARKLKNSKSQRKKGKMVLEPQTMRKFKKVKNSNIYDFADFATAVLFCASGAFSTFRAFAFSRRRVSRFLAPFSTFHVFASACMCLVPFFFAFDFVGACIYLKFNMISL